MGKKKITKQNETELMEETSKLESAVKKAAVAPAQRHTKSANIYIQATYNNTIMTATDNSGNALAWSSSGALGFKGAKSYSVRGFQSRGNSCGKNQKIRFAGCLGLC